MNSCSSIGFGSVPICYKNLIGMYTLLTKIGLVSLAISSVSCNPSRYAPLFPQENTSKSLLIKIKWLINPCTDFILTSNLILFGFLLNSDFSPIPSCPYSLYPHDYTFPSVVTPYEPLSVASIYLNSSWLSLDRMVGCFTFFTSLHTNWLIPHTHSLPSVVIPNEWHAPAATDTNRNSVGTKLGLVFGSSS